MNTPFFFLHIPRTAGTTINSIIKHNFKPHEILSIYRDSDYRRHETVDAALLDRIRLIQGHLLLETYDPPRIYGRDVRVFTFLRNPVERLVSEYLFQKSWPDNHLYRYLNEENVSFADYITSQAKILKYRGKNFMTRAVSGMDFDLGSFPRAALDTAKRHIERVFGFVGIQEMFDESLLLLRDFLGLRSLYHERMNVLRDGAKERVTEADRALAWSATRRTRNSMISPWRRPQTGSPGVAGIRPGTHGLSDHQRQVRPGVRPDHRPGRTGRQRP
jgi:hypothetical protein